ncbi:coiled-coil domain-containing protein [Methanofollis fontis]|uniref:Cell surface protein n=1 Tax=Methanofollis fontis TaxID=2052832 RepID=A0A483CNR2_9EURY|nr:hypothetical protein [Methanofollis fontis]TAJ44242.1 hypothetical protein CUJ86_09490 [Methanofollis fontis]
MMFRFIRGLFEKNEEETLSLTADEAGLWLDEREKVIESGLAEKTETCRTIVSESLSGLENMRSELAKAEGREDIHPKLRSVTERSLPAFLAALGQQTSRSLPADPDEFYPVAADILTSLLKIQKRQGRYLAGAFPEEMKEIRGFSAEIGRSINDLTEAVKDAQAARKQIESARDALSALNGSYEEIRTVQEKMPAIHARIAQSEGAIREKEELVRVLRDDAEYLACMDLQGEADRLEKEEGAAAQDLRNLGTRTGRVLKKAEKIVMRSDRPKDTKTLSACIRLLENPGAAGIDAVLSSLSPAVAMVRAQIASGSLSLKGKEDLALFCDEERLENAFSAAFARLESAHERTSEIHREIQGCTLPIEVAALDRELGEISAAVEADRTAFKEAEERVALLSADLPRQAQAVQDALTAVAGTPVDFRDRHLPKAGAEKTA